MSQLFVADIGGTNSRIGHFEVVGRRDARLVDSRSFPTDSVSSLTELFAVLRKSGFGLSPLEASYAVLAVAGPVRKGGTFCQLTNAPWNIDLTQCQGLLPEGRTSLINDFVAQALGSRCPEIMDSAFSVQKGKQEHGVIAAVGAGTGFGACALVPDPDDLSEYIPLPSEAGHAPLPLMTQRELDFMHFLKNRTGYTYAFGDIVLSGRGLSLMHWFLTNRRLSPREVAAECGPHSETAAWFARLYGRVCRSFALCVLPVGGLRVCGGLASRNPHFVTHPEFLREFRDCPDYAELLNAIPIDLLTSPESGLHGAALWARRMALA